MMERISQIVLAIFGIILIVLLVVGLSSSCRVRPAPDMVTPVPAATTDGESATEAPDQPEGGDGAGTPTPTLILDVAEATLTAEAAATMTVVLTAAPGATEPAATAVVDVTTMPEASPTPATPAEPPTLEPIPPPTGEATPVVATPLPDTGGLPPGLVPGSTIQHVVVEGEWLLQIARCYGADYNAVVGSNYVPFPDYIMPGTVLMVPSIGSQDRIIGPPCVVPYTVQIGDTWDVVATRFETTVAILQRANPNGLVAGRPIWVPRNN